MQFGVFLEETGLTHRRFFRWMPYFDDWYETVNERHKPSFREYNPAVIPKIKILVGLAEGFGGRIPIEVLKEIYDVYEQGHYKIGEGVFIEWEV